MKMATYTNSVYIFYFKNSCGSSLYDIYYISYNSDHRMTQTWINIFPNWIGQNGTNLGHIMPPNVTKLVHLLQNMSYLLYSIIYILAF